MKRLLSAGAPSIYQLGPCSGMKGALAQPRIHHAEWYRLGFDDQQLMQEVAELVAVYSGRCANRDLSAAGGRFIGSRQCSAQ